MAQELLTDSERDYFRKYESMFQSEGWRLLVQELEAELSTLPEQMFWGAKSWEDMLAARVRAVVLAEMARYEQVVEQRKANIVQQRAMQFDEAIESTRPDL